jgi:hypothetical protein
LRKLIFELVYIDVPQCAADGSLTGHPLPSWLKGGQQERCMALHPVRDGSGTPLVAEHGAGNHA